MTLSFSSVLSSTYPKAGHPFTLDCSRKIKTKRVSELLSVTRISGAREKQWQSHQQSPNAGWLQLVHGFEGVQVPD